MPTITADSHGHHIGVLLLTDGGPFVPGDVRDTGGYGYPVLYQTVPGSTSARVFSGDPDLEEAVVATARELERRGVRGISSDCGYFLHFQDTVRNAVKVPVALSALMQLPFVSAFLGQDRSIGILTSSSTRMGNRTLELTGLDPGRRVVVAGLEDKPEWIRVMRDGGDDPDFARIGREVVAAADMLAGDNPDLGAIIVACSLIPRYSRDIQEATGLPVFDFINMIDYVQSGAYQRVHPATPERDGGCH